MLLDRLVVGAFQCNCFILACEASKEAIVIDPGDEADNILERLRSHGITVKALLHTHAHLDHIGASTKLHRELEAPICLHRGDAWLYENLPTQGAMFGLKLEQPSEVNEWLLEGADISFGRHVLSVIHTPGHTPGSICFKLDKQDLLFSGDTLFAGSIGRTDLWGGSMPQIIESIKTKLLTLDEDTKVLCGHGPDTVIGQEKQHNQFLT